MRITYNCLSKAWTNRFDQDKKTFTLRERHTQEKSSRLSYLNLAHEGTLIHNQVVVKPFQIQLDGLTRP